MVEQWATTFQSRLYNGGGNVVTPPNRGFATSENTYWVVTRRRKPSERYLKCPYPSILILLHLERFECGYESLLVHVDMNVLGMRIDPQFGGLLCAFFIFSIFI